MTIYNAIYTRINIERYRKELDRYRVTSEGIRWKGKVSSRVNNLMESENARHENS